MQMSERATIKILVRILVRTRFQTKSTISSCEQAHPDANLLHNQEP